MTRRRDSRAHLISISRLAVRGGTEVSVQRFRGAVRAETEADFACRLREGGARAPYLVVDLSELEHLDAGGLALLLEQSAAQERRGGWLRVVAPSPTVTMILGLAGVGPTFDVYPVEADALRDVGDRAA